MSRPLPPDAAAVTPHPTAARPASTVARLIEQTRRRTSVAGLPRRWPAAVLASVAVVPGLVLGVWLVVAIPLLAVGAFRPAFVVPLFLVLLAATLVLAGRRLIRRAAESVGDVPAWSVVAVLGTAVGFVLTNGLLHAEKVILRRDAAAYSLFGHWLAHHSEKVVPSGIDMLGGSDQALHPVSQGFYPHGTDLVPQFMSGLPTTLAAVEWVSSWRATLWVPAVLGGLALLAFAGLAARLLGARWAALATLALALAFPFWHAARETLSEPMATVLLLGGLGLLADAARDPARGILHGGRLAAGAGGALIAVSAAVRVDSLREATLVVPVIGWLAVRRSPAWWALAGGLIAGAAVGVVDGWFLTRPYVTAISNSLKPLGLILAVTVAATAAGAVWLRGRPSWRGPAWLAPAAAWLVVAAGVGFAVRPLLQTVHGVPRGSQLAADVASLQREQGLAVDPTRSYDELSLHWLAWSVGWFTVAAALLGASVLAYTMLRTAVGQPQRQWESAAARPPSRSMWVAPLLLFLGTTATTLWRPGISPDHPWADRRFVPVILPGVVILAVWALRFGYGRMAARQPPRLSARIAIANGGILARAALAVGAVAVLGPIIFASAPLLGSRTEAGSMDAIERACAATQPDEVAFFVDGRGAAEWPAVMRIACGVNAAVVRPGNPDTLARLAYRAKRAGSQPVLMLTGSPKTYTQLGPAIQVVGQTSSEDQHLLTRRPDGTQPLRFDLWSLRL